MAKRVFEIARELGVKSKAVLDKCEAEGVPNMHNHMSSVSVGLEATIREWFSTGADGGTAVETAAHVDFEKVRVAPAGRAKAIKRAAVEESVGESNTVSEYATATTTLDVPPPAQSVEQQPEEAPAGGSAGGGTALRAVSDSAARILDQETADHARSMASVPEGSAAEARPSGSGSSGGAAGTKPEAQPTVARLSEPCRPASRLETAPDQQSTARPSRTRAIPEPRPSGSGRTGPRVLMNQPVRPTGIQPAGPKLEVRKPAALSGPKVVRIEAPDAVERPRSRPPSADRGPRGGGGVVVEGDGGQDGGDGSRRNRRRRGGPGDAPAKPPVRRGGSAPREGTGAKWREQDLAEREARLSRAGGFLRQRRRDMKVKQQSGSRPGAEDSAGPIQLAAPFTIKELSAATGVKASEIIKKLFLGGVMATVNSGIDPLKAQEIMIEFDIELEVTEAKTAEQTVREDFAFRVAVDERPRDPIVTILGHVDHGKTSLLDRIRHANVAEGEAGGITQATSAFRVPVHFGDESKHIVFFDTPGHQAFTAMRARGAKITDIVVLVVAADDGVMPQTIESINHAKAAGVPIIIALNKIDKPEATDANIQRILGQLAEHELNPTEWGGQTEVVKTSAVKNIGIQDLLETIDLQAQVLELSADFGGPARGAVIECAMIEGKGPTANLLVQDGELKLGDFIVAGRAFGRVRDIVDDRNIRLKSAGPASPVQVSGLDELPAAGDKFYIVDSLRKAQGAAEQRRAIVRERELAQPKVTLESMLSQMKESDTRELRVVIKADVQGSLDVLRKSAEELSTSEVRVRVLHAAVGGVTESDVLLADASSAVIIGFNVIASAKARQFAEQKGVQIRLYEVIYHITDDLKRAAEGLLEPDIKQEVLGHAEVRKVFRVSKVGAVAGCYITDGVIERNALIRVTRNDIVVENARVLSQLKRFKDDAKEVHAGQECGMKINGYDDIKEGDILECYRQVEVKRTL